MRLTPRTLQDLKRAAALSAAVAAALGNSLCTTPARANTEYDVNNGATDLTSVNTYTVGGVTPAPAAPSSTSDITFNNATYSPSAFTVATALSAGTINDLSGTALTISGTGPITLNGGSNSVSPTNGGSASDLIFVASGASLTDSAPITLAASGNFDAAGTGALSVSGVVSGAFGVTLNGTGAVTLAGTNTYTGNTTLNAGTLNFNKTGAVGTGTLVIAAGTLDNTSGAAVTNANNNAMQWNGDFAFTGGTGTTHDLNLGTGAVTVSASRTLTVNAGNLTVGGAISGTNTNLTKAGAGTLTLTGAITTGSGGLAVTGGTLVIGTTAAPASTFTGNVTVDGASSVLQMFGSNGTATSGPLGFVSTTTPAFKTVTLTNGGTFRPSSSYNSNVPTTSLPGNGYVFSIGTGGGTFDTPSGVTLTLDDGAGAGTGTGNSELQGSGTLTKVGAGTLSLGNSTSNFSTFTGAIVVNVGTVKIGALSAADSPLGATTAGTTINDGATLDLNGQSAANIGAEPLTLNGGLTGTTGALTNSSGTAAGFSGTITLASTAAVGGTGSITASGVVSGAGGLTKLNTGTLTLTGVNTYTGATTVSAGTLALGSGGSLAGTAITVGGTSAASLLVKGNYTVGTAGSPSLTLTANTGALSTVDGTVNTLTLNSATAGATVFTLGGGNTLGFESSITTSDSVTLGAGLAASVTGSNTVNLTVLARPTANQTYTLINAPGGGLGTNANFTLGTVGGTNTTGITYSLNDTGTALQLVATLTASSPGVAYFRGQKDNNWNNLAGSPTTTNFTTDAAGTTDPQQIPGSNSDVFYTANNATNFATSALNAAFVINSLTLGTGSASGQAVTIAPGSGGSLTINGAATSNATTYQINGTTNVSSAGNPAGNGILVVPGAGPVTISAPVTLGGAQSWTNNSTSTLTLSGGVTGGANLLTFAGAGATTISGATAFTTNAGATVSSGAGVVTISTPVTLGGASTFTNNSTNTLNLGGAVAAGGNALTVTGSGNTTIGGNLTSTSTLTKTGTGTLLLAGATNSVQTLAINSNSIIDIGSGVLSLNNSGASTITSTTGGTINASGGGVLKISSNTAPNFGDNGTAAGTFVTINARITSNGTANDGFESCCSGGTMVLNNPNNDFTGDLNLSNGNIQASIFGNAGTASPLGKGTNIFISANANTLRYTGTGESTNRVISLSGTTGGGTLEQAGTGTLRFTANFATPGAGAKTLTLQGSTAGVGQIDGAIINNSGTNTTALTKTGTGTWALTGANTYTGATLVNLGTLTLNNPAASPVLGATAVTVGNTSISATTGNATLLVKGNNTVGTAAGGSISVTGGDATTTGQGTLSLADGTLNTLTFTTLTTPANSLNLGSATNPAVVSLELGGSGSDKIVLGTSNKLNVLAGGTVGGTAGVGAVLNIVPLGGIAPGTYTLLSYPGGQTSAAANGGFAFANGTQTTTLNGATLTLNNSATAETLTVAGNTAASPATAYFQGSIDNNWNSFDANTPPNSNWTTDAAGATNANQVPGPTTDVHFYAANANTANLATNLGQNFTVNSLTLDGGTLTQNVSIGSGASTPNATLTIAPAASTAGITLSSGAGSLTITAPVALGAAQTWTNNSANPLTLSGSTLSLATSPLTVTGTGNTTIADTISGSAALTKSGTGTLTVSGTGNTSGGIVILGGTVQQGADNALSGGPVVFGTTNSGTTGTLNLGSTNLTVPSLSVISNTGAVSPAATPNVITIGAGKTLTINNGLIVGFDASSISPAATTNSKLTVSGAGGVNVAGGAFTLGVSQGTANASNSSIGTLDMTGLTGSFTATAASVSIGSGNTAAGVLMLGPGTNTITAPTMTLGNSNQNNAGPTFTVTDTGGNLTGVAGYILLGTGTNVLRADTINMGFSKVSGAILFASQAANSPGTLTVTNAAGNGRANFDIGDQTSTGTSANVTGTLDLRGHSANVNAGTVALATNNNAGSTGTANGQVFFDTGAFNATTLNLGTRTGTGNGTVAATATLTVGGGAFTVSGATAFGNNAGSAGSAGLTSTLNLTAGSFTTNTLTGAVKNGANTGTTSATLNVSGGAFTVNSGSVTLASNATAAGSATAALNLTGGSATFNGDLLKGTATGTVTTSVTLNGGLLDMTGHNLGGAASAALDTIALQAGTLQNVANINGGAAVTKTTAGTLTLAGTNAYAGTVTVNAGTLLVNGSFAGGATVTAGTLGGSGSIAGAATVASGAKLSPGNSPGVLTIGGPLTLSSGSSYLEEVGGPTPGNSSNNYDQTNVTSSTGTPLTVNGSNLVVNGFNGYGSTGNASEAYFILTQGGTTAVSGTFNGLPEGATVTFADGSGTAQITYLANWTGSQATSTLTGGNDVALYNVNTVPEPAALGLLGVGALGLLARRRRRPAGA